MGFEEYILDLGYQKMIMNTRTMKLEASNSGILSTMGNIDYRYVKEGYKTIIYGLYEYNKPPVWMWPKPWSIAEGEDLTTNDGLNRVFQRYSNKEIYKAMNNE